MSTENQTAPSQESTPATESTTPSTLDQSSSGSEQSAAGWIDHLESVFSEDAPNAQEDTKPESGESETSESETNAEGGTEEPESSESEKDTSSSEGSEEEPKNKTNEARRAFKEYRVKNRELSKQLETLQEQIKQLKESPNTAANPQLEEENKMLKETLEAANAELSSVAVEATSDYQQQVIRPLAETLKTSSVLAERYNVSKRLLERAIEESAVSGAPTEELVDASTAMSGFDQQELHLLVRSMRSLMERKNWFRENARTLSEKFKQQKEAELSRQMEARRETITNAAEDVWERISNLPPVKSLPDEERKKAYEAAFESVRDLENAPPDIRSFVAFSGALMPSILKQLKSSSTKIKELEASLSKYTKARPKAGGGNSDGGAQGVPEGVGFLDAIEASMG